ncbi:MULTISPECIES: type VI secretion system baseplate subunit TssG [Gammaproteobacteria]|uniref:type VI secretion system baseplate subunit TssG n=1 Tax=Gammaproteobacteria TaxID=1236 RepID=UPI001ADA2753|nr:MULTISPECIES: type VI secretion system baseplate subunit TssG [Gammaproteobacteria]MBO9480944.1 type VI secretion system baseplate subunit TssG [Salinisphaera sp. G21_0]MBO9494517.1 type VI secretion system baseplate subunit TssG [Thalassotalea sp. G20_0]
MTDTIQSSLFKQSERFEFRQVLRILLAIDGKLPGILTSLYGYQSDQEVFALNATDNETVVMANLPCLTGPKGIMPHYFQDALRQVYIEQQKSGLFNFIELFNRTILEKRFAIDQYASLPMMLERIHQLGKWPGAFLDINGLSQTTDRVFTNLTLLRFHSILKVKTTYIGDLSRMLSFYFNLPVKVRWGHLSHYTLNEDQCWHLGYKTSNPLGRGLLLGRQVMTNDMSCTIHVSVNSRGLWQKLKTKNTINSLYNYGYLLMNCTTLKCYAEIPGCLLEAPVLSAGRIRLGQYQVLGPQSCDKKKVQVLLAKT